MDLAADTVAQCINLHFEQTYVKKSLEPKLSTSFHHVTCVGPGPEAGGGPGPETGGGGDGLVLEVGGVGGWSSPESGLR